jgi:hypothetical protein
VERVIRYIQQQNHDVYEQRGVVFGDPMDRGLRCVSLTNVNWRSSLCDTPSPPLPKVSRASSFIREGSGQIIHWLGFCVCMPWLYWQDLPYSSWSRFGWSLWLHQSFWLPKLKYGHGGAMLIRPKILPPLMNWLSREIILPGGLALFYWLF